MGFFNKIKDAFKKTSERISLSIGGKKIDGEFIQEIEDALIIADVGVKTAAELAQKISNKKFSKELTELDIKQFLANEIYTLLKPYENDFFSGNFSHNPEIILVIGVNGNGKTTTVAKIANIFKTMGHKPLLVAADTFRAAATEQLKCWAQRIGVDIRTGKEKADVAGFVYDSIKQADSSTHDVILIDTAGRMQNRSDLLDELEKIKRVIKKLNDTAPHKTILVLDGLTGQATHNQVNIFLNKIGIDGIIITKLDGTAKGGAIISLTKKYKIPIFALGIGEDLDDLKTFDAQEYSRAILGI
ncbi:MAG: signal recognition particle-docking protein FtsY [Holosporaceae bacterium]|jgi:fused signal recognition particle receptor|nr:signal recognition particle-docking protein FtsY [Holosporaceae bacterium]